MVPARTSSFVLEIALCVAVKEADNAERHGLGSHGHTGGHAAVQIIRQQQCHRNISNCLPRGLLQERPLRLQHGNVLVMSQVGNPCPTLGQLLVSQILHALLEKTSTKLPGQDFVHRVAQIRRRQKPGKSRVQEVSRDRSRTIRPSLIAPKHSKTSVLGLKRGVSEL